MDCSGHKRDEPDDFAATTGETVSQMKVCELPYSTENSTCTVTDKRIYTASSRLADSSTDPDAVTGAL